MENLINVKRLMNEHNDLVKDLYKANDVQAFAVYLDSSVNKGDEDFYYVEIASNETLSGHAEILELD